MPTKTMNEPSYLKLYRDGILKDRVQKAVDQMKHCKLCPRECGINRLSDETGYC
jgi:putative pyruvate formate lyase activating enzyme